MSQQQQLPISSFIEVDPETLSRYRQDVVQNITSWQKESTGSLSPTLQMTLAAFASRGGGSNNRSSSSSSSQPRKCVLCKTVERFDNNNGNNNNSNEKQKQKPQDHPMYSSPLDNLLQDFTDHGWVTYDGLDHCFNCARRLACEILAPHFSKSRRENSKKILNRIIEKERQPHQLANTDTNSAPSSTLSSPSAVPPSSSSPGRTWLCSACGTSNDPTNQQCSVCETSRPQPLICPYCNLDAAESEFCPNDPSTPLESYLAYEKNDPVLNFGNSGYTRNSFSSNATPNETADGRHDVWRCENKSCEKLNLGLIHRDFCRSCKKHRIWHCLGCKNEYIERSFCPRCGSRHRAGSHQEVEEFELCKLTGMSVAEARRVRQVNTVLDQAKVRLVKRVEKQLGLVNVKAVDDGNCLFRALSFQLFRTDSFHYLLRLLAVEHIIFEKDKFINFVVLSSSNSDENNNKNTKNNYENDDDRRLSSTEQMERQFVTYCRRLSRDGEWGDALVLHAIAKIFHSQVHIVSAAQDQWHNVISPVTSETGKSIISPIKPENPDGHNNNDHEEENSFGKVGLLFISFIAELHYNSIVYSRDDSVENIVPYRKWLSFGDLSASNLGEDVMMPMPSEMKNNNNNTTSSSRNQHDSGPITSGGNSRSSSAGRITAGGPQNNNTTQGNPMNIPSSSSSSSQQQKQIQNRNNQVLTKPIQVRTLSQLITPNAPFDRVAAYFPSQDTGAPLFWMAFHPISNRLFLSTQPQFFRRHAAAEIPTATKNAFPRKAIEGRCTSFFLCDEVGKKLVTTIMPYPTNPIVSPATDNHPAMSTIETLQYLAETSPRPTVVTTFEDGSCAIGPWIFVFEFHGPRISIKLHRPSTAFSGPKPARLEFVDEKLVHKCTFCEGWYISGHAAHRCKQMVRHQQQHQHHQQLHHQQQGGGFMRR